MEDTELNRPLPNVAHFLLFDGIWGSIQDPHALRARQTSIRILLELVKAGTPQLRGKQIEEGEMGPPLDPLFLSPWACRTLLWGPLSALHSPENI